MFLPWHLAVLIFHISTDNEGDKSPDISGTSHDWLCIGGLLLEAVFDGICFVKVKKKLISLVIDAEDADGQQSDLDVLYLLALVHYIAIDVMKCIWSFNIVY